MKGKTRRFKHIFKMKNGAKTVNDAKAYLTMVLKMCGFYFGILKNPPKFW